MVVAGETQVMVKDYPKESKALCSKIGQTSLGTVGFEFWGCGLGGLVLGHRTERSPGAGKSLGNPAALKFQAMGEWKAYGV